MSGRTDRGWGGQHGFWCSSKAKKKSSTWKNRGRGLPLRGPGAPVGVGQVCCWEVPACFLPWPVPSPVPQPVKLNDEQLALKRDTWRQREKEGKKGRKEKAVVFAACHGGNSPFEAEMNTLPVEWYEPPPLMDLGAHLRIDEAQRRAQSYAGAGAEQSQSPDFWSFSSMRSLSRMSTVPSDSARDPERERGWMPEGFWGSRGLPGWPGLSQPSIPPGDRGH